MKSNRYIKNAQIITTGNVLFKYTWNTFYDSLYRIVNWKWLKTMQSIFYDQIIIKLDKKL